MHGYLWFSEGYSTDWLSGGEYLDEDVEQWLDGRFTYKGRQHSVAWLDESESARMSADSEGPLT